MIQSVDPKNGKLLKTFKELTSSELEEKIALADKTFRIWRRSTFAKRKELLHKVATVLRKRKSQYGAIMTMEMGKTLASSIPEVAKCADICDYFSDNGEAFLKNDMVASEAKTSYVEFDPIGVILGIMPWNYPFSQVFRYAVPSIMAGNVTVLKHASNVPQSALIIEKAFAEAGATSGIFQTLLISSAQAQQLVADSRIRAVTLTGSEGAGREIAKTSGANLKKVVLELGGSDPFVVLDDADIEAAAKIGASSRLLVSGQTCISAKRFIIESKVASKFLELFKKEMAKKVIGDPMDLKTEVGPLSSESVVKKLEYQVAESVKMGAKIVLGGKRLSGPGYFYLPTILTEVTSDMPVYREETFGPVAAFMIVKDDSEALKVANDTHFGLGATVFGKNKKRIEFFTKNIEAGNVYVNSMVRSNPLLPFGGTKSSGFGRELGTYGIKEFVNIKTVFINL